MVYSRRWVNSFVVYCFSKQTDVLPGIFLLLSSDSNQNEPAAPILSLMVASDTDQIEMAWTPASDGLISAEDVQYNIHLSTTEDFAPDHSSLKTTVTGSNQVHIGGLLQDTLYFGKVEAVLSKKNLSLSNSLQVKTYKQKVVVNESTNVVKAEDLGLGVHSTTDGSTYTFVSGTPPEIDSVLFSENEAGSVTMRRVDSTSSSGGTITVNTSSASLNDIFTIASLYSNSKIFDVASFGTDSPQSSKQIATRTSVTRSDGSLYHRIDWKNRLLIAEQTNKAYNQEDLIVQPQGEKSIITLPAPADVSQSFVAEVTADFEPSIITTAEWGGILPTSLDSAKVAAKGKLSFKLILN